MAAPGFSVNDLIQACVQVKIVYDAFFDEHSSSAAQLKGFRDEIGWFQTSLREQMEIVEEEGLEYPVEAVNNTLQQCYKFLNRYKPVLERRRNSVANVFRTTQFAFDKDVEKLRVQMADHRQNIIQFNLAILVRRSRQANTAPTPEPIPIPGSGYVTSSPRLVPIRSYEHLSPFSTPPSSLPSPEIPSEVPAATRNWRLSTSHSAERLSRVPEDPPPSELPAEVVTELPAEPVPEHLAAHRSSSVNESFVPAGRGSPQPPLHHSPALLPSPTVSSPVQYNSARDSLSSIPALVLPQAALPYIVAEVFLGPKQKVDLKRKAVGRDFSQGRDMIIVDENENVRFRHRIKGPRTQSCFPYTWYPGFEKKDFVITFKSGPADAHSISFKGAPPICAVPKYVFTKREDFEDFQYQLRGKRLEATFDASKVSTAKSGKTGDATSQQLKIWLDDYKQGRTLSYFVNKERVGYHREFPLVMFEPEFLPDKAEDAKLTITFASAPERKRARTDSSAYSLSPTEMTNTITPSIFSSNMTEVASSASSITTVASSRVTTGLHQFDGAGQAEDAKHEQSLRSIAKDLKFLRITFSNADEAERFKGIFRRSYDEETARPQNQYMQDWQMGVERGRTESVAGGGCSPAATPLMGSPVLHPKSPVVHPRSPVLHATRKRTGTFRDV